jgi:hypothetical protein
MLRDVPVRQAFEERELDAGTLVGRQAVQGGFEPLLPLHLFEADRAERRSRAKEGWLVLVKRFPPAARAIAPHPVDGAMAGEQDHPGGRGEPPRLEGACLLPDLQEDLLQHLFRLGPGA